MDHWSEVNNGALYIHHVKLEISFPLTLSHRRRATFCVALYHTRLLFFLPCPFSLVSFNKTSAVFSASVDSCNTFHDLSIKWPTVYVYSIRGNDLLAFNTDNFWALMMWAIESGVCVYYSDAFVISLSHARGASAVVCVSYLLVESP